MIGKILFLATVAAVSSGAVPDTRSHLAGVDPDTLSCDPSGQVFLLLPHFTDCNKFYMCAHGVEVEFPCGSPDLVFDFELQTCNWNWATTCRLRTLPTESSEEHISEEDISEEDISEGSGDEAESDEGSGDGSGFGMNFFESDTAPQLDDYIVELMRSGVHAASDQGVSQLNCAVAKTSTRLAAYRGDCQRYWRCNNGSAESAFCSDGLYFNPRTLACDFEANVPCARDADIVELGEEFLAM